MKHFLKTAGFALGIVLAASAAHASSGMQCSPLQIITTVYPTGTTYTADAAGVVTNVDPRDVNSLHQSGCVQLGLQSGLCGELLNVNMNVTTDQPLNWFVPASQNYQLLKILAKNVSRSYQSGSAAGGIYTAAAKGGTAVVANSQAYTALHATAATNTLTLTLVSGVGDTTTYSNSPLVFSLTTADGTAGTLDLFAYCDIGK